MNINYDPEVDALDIVFRRGKVYETREITKDMFLDIDKDGGPLSLEVLGASKKLSRDGVSEVTFKLPAFSKDKYSIGV